MKRIETGKAWGFVGTLSFIALLINSRFAGPVISDSTQPQFLPQPPQQRVEAEKIRATQKDAEDAATASRKTAENAAVEHTKLLERYLNPGTYARKSGVKTVAIAAVSEHGKFNRAVNAGIASRLKTDSIEILPSLFTSEFVSDGVFSRACNDSSQITKALDLVKFLDVLLLTRQRVGYSTNGASLQNVITANMQLEVMISAVGAPNQPQAWTLTANGAGFTPNGARQLAEERLLKQIAKDPRMSLSQITSDTQNP
jgi:hypothetical protein